MVEIQLFIVTVCLVVGAAYSSNRNTPFNGPFTNAYRCDVSGPLGMITGEVQDWQISSSSSYPQELDRQCHERYARIYQPNGYAWCAGYKSSSEWLQVDLGLASNVSGVMLQGRSDGNEWVTSFSISFSRDRKTWNFVTDVYGSKKVFIGNDDSYKVKHYYFDEPVEAKLIKFHPVSWQQHPSMRVEIIGCQHCKQLLGLPPYGKLSANSFKSYRQGSSCKPDDGYYYSNNGWCARKEREGEWLQLDVGPPTLITGVVTRGRGDSRKREWVTSYNVAYSNFSIPDHVSIDQSPAWHWYSDDNGRPIVFNGNVDKYMERYQWFDEPLVARFVRFYPLTWNKRISMRVGVLGCPYAGNCRENFVRINPAAPCLENVAYRKEARLKRRRQRKRALDSDEIVNTEESEDWVNGRQAARAVDGHTSTSLQSCTILDNFDTDFPVWMVDLGSVKQVRGILILTGAESSSIHQQINDLEKLTVFVGGDDTNMANDGRELRTPDNECASITKLNDALFQPRLHFQCIRPLAGRYVLIEAWGSPSRWQHLFKAVLCEVMVYE